MQRSKNAIGEPRPPSWVPVLYGRDTSPDGGGVGLVAFVREAVFQVESRRIVCPSAVRISTATMSRRALELAPMTVSSRLGGAFQVATRSAAPLRSMTTIASVSYTHL